MKLIQGATAVPDSKIWELQDTFYAECGPRAWSDKLVPHGPTSNCIIADVYASITAAFFRDLIRAGKKEPPLILEVGGGPGRFAWQFLNRLLNYQLADENKDFVFNYLLTDAAESNFANWKTKKRLVPLFESGLLDFGILRVGEGLDIKTETSGTLTAADLGNRPVILITNYLHCSIPCDLYRVRDHKVYRELIALYERDPESVKENAGIFHRIKAKFTSEERQAPYTGHPAIDGVIEDYRGLPGDSCIPVPELSIRFIENFLNRDAPFLKLAGDLAYTDPKSFREDDPFVFDDYFAYHTNFHMMGEVFRRYGGTVQFQRYQERRFSTAAFMKAGPGELEETAQVAKAVLYEFTPYDTYSVLKTFRQSVTKARHRQIASCLRLARLDPRVAKACIPLLIESLPDERRINIEQLRDMFLESYTAFFPDESEEDDFDLEIADLFLRVGLNQEAHDLLVQGAIEFGRTSPRLYLLAYTLATLGLNEEALAVAEECVQIDVKRTPAQQLLDDLRERAAAPRK